MGVEVAPLLPRAIPPTDRPKGLDQATGVGVGWSSALSAFTHPTPTPQCWVGWADYKGGP